MSTIVKERNISVDIIKFFAVFLIINSHMDIMYPKYSVLATGGAIGDVLFLFCSGFTLFMGKTDRFDNWYKRRINRIYPTVFVCAFLAAVFFGIHLDMKSVILIGGGEFVAFIMIYYVALYVIRKYMYDKLTYVYLVVGAAVVIVYIFFFPYKYETSSRGIYGIASYFRWLPYFLFMLLGAHLGKTKRTFKYNVSFDSIKLVVCVALFYGIQLISKKYPVIAPMQIITVIPLIGIVFYFYKICNDHFLKKIYYSKYFHGVLMLVSGLCLESYLIQGYLFTDKMNGIFPLNLIIMTVFILTMSYITRCLARIFSQTFEQKDYCWKDVFKLY